MSLGNVYLKSSDGKWYEWPTLDGVTQDGKKWYLCFDEDDPPELVVQTNGNGKEIDAAKILRAAGVSFGGVRFTGVCGRMIGRAASFWVTITAPIPTPTKFDAVYESQPQRQGTYYSFEPRRRRRGGAMSRVIAVEKCLGCPYHHMTSLYRSVCKKAQWQQIECDSVREFPAWCPLPESVEKENER